MIMQQYMKAYMKAKSPENKKHTVIPRLLVIVEIVHCVNTEISPNFLV